MERKLSQKAAQMRQRLFTRSSNNRGRAATMTSPASETSTSNSRSRSATTPVTFTPARPASDNIDESRYYHFTDEPGYYRPASPLIHRQEVEEDLEDNVKHACSLLVESIERGLPIWPSFDTNVQPSAQQGGMAQAPTHETRSNLQGQMAQLSLSPVALDNLMIPARTSNDWDYQGGDTPYSPPSKYGRVCQNSFASAGTGRFYGRRLSTSPEAQIEETEEGVEPRARGRSFRTDTTSPRSRSQSRSRSSSPGFFPFSPPQLDTVWGRDNTQILESHDDQLFTPKNAFLGAEGITWLRASLDLQNNDRPWTGTGTAAQNDRGDPNALGPGSGPGAAPRRFYSTRRANSSNKRSRDWDAFEVHGSRESGIYRGLSMRDFSMDEERKRAHEFSYPVWMDRDSDAEMGEPQAFYSVMPGGMPARHRRKRASELLKKLTGLGTKRKDADGLERRAVEVV